jgi:type II secretory pathway component PulF
LKRTEVQQAVPAALEFMTRNGSADGVVLTRWNWFWAILITLPVAFMALRFYPAVPQYAALFKGFGAEVPTLTKIVMLWAAPISFVLRFALFSQLALFIGLLIKRTSTLRKTFFAVALFNLLMVGVIFVALYLPILRVGKVV